MLQNYTNEPDIGLAWELINMEVQSFTLPYCVKKKRKKKKKILSKNPYTRSCQTARGPGSAPKQNEPKHI